MDKKFNLEKVKEIYEEYAEHQELGPPPDEQVRKATESTIRWLLSFMLHSYTVIPDQKTLIVCADFVSCSGIVLIHRPNGEGVCRIFRGHIVKNYKWVNATHFSSVKTEIGKQMKKIVKATKNA